MKKTNKGFTIVELVIVIAVIAILAAVLIPTFGSVIEKANQSSALQTAKGALTNLTAELAGGSSYASEVDMIKEIRIVTNGKCYTFAINSDHSLNAKPTVNNSEPALTQGQVVANALPAAFTDEFDAKEVKVVVSTSSSLYDAVLGTATEALAALKEGTSGANFNTIQAIRVADGGKYYTYTVSAGALNTAASVSETVPAPADGTAVANTLPDGFATTFSTVSVIVTNTSALYTAG